MAVRAVSAVRAVRRVVVRAVKAARAVSAVRAVRAVREGVRVEGVCVRARRARAWGCAWKVRACAHEGVCVHEIKADAQAGE